MKSRNLRRWSPSLGCLLWLGAAGCGGAAGATAEAVRPQEPTASQALGEAPAETGPGCRSVSPRAMPFLVDWKDEERGALEVAMQRGVAVVRYDCAGIRLLSDCRLPGEYGFAPVSVKRRQVELTADDDLAATLPLSAATLSAELRRGLRLSLLYVMVGQRGTTLDEAPRSALAGSCEGATHFVRSAFVGAFQLGSQSSGRVAAGAGAPGAGASTASQSARKVDSSDGDVGKCEGGDGKAPPNGCAALVRVQLAPLVDAGTAAEGEEVPDLGAEGARAATDPCSEGFVLDGSGKCTRRASGGYLCKPSDVDDCERQCEAGSKESCYNAALGQYRPGRHADPKTAHARATELYEKGCNAGHAPSCGRAAGAVQFGPDPQRARSLFQQGCDGGDASSCGQLGRALAAGRFGPPDAIEGFVAMRKACHLGSGAYCAEVARALIEGRGVAKDPTAGVDALERSCQAGDTANCRELARLHRTGAGGVKKDPARARELLEPLCARALPVLAACDELGAMVLGGEGGPADVERGRALLERGCPERGGGYACVRLGNLYLDGKGATKDPKRALEYFERGCPPGGRAPGPGCFEAAELHARGAAEVEKQELKAAEGYARACSAYDPSPERRQETPKLACGKAGKLFEKLDRDRAREAYQRGCQLFRDAGLCASMKKLGGALPAPPPPTARPPVVPPPPRSAPPRPGSQ